MSTSNAIFISYRRSDSQDVTGRIYDRLRSHFDSALIFKDIYSIAYGENFQEKLKDSVSHCKVLVAVIGLKWLEVLQERLVQPETDWVREEIALAFQQNVLVIPALVGGASMPKSKDLPDDLKALGPCNAAQVRPGIDFDADMARLIQRLADVVGGVSPVSKPQTSARQSFYRRQISQLEEQLTAVEADLASAPREVDRMRLENEAKTLLKKIEQLNEKLK